MSSGDFRRWFAAQPFTTKWLTVFSLTIPLLMKLAIVPPNLLVYDWYAVSRKFEIWRMATCFFLAKVNFNFIISLYFRFQYSFYLETGAFLGRPADYLYFLLLSTLAINIINVFTGLAVLWESLSMVIIYLWSQYNRDTTVNFMFGIKFRAIFLPAVLAAFEFLLVGDLYGPLLGIVVGHLYYFLKEIYVRQDPRWRRRLEAPALLAQMVPPYVSAEAGTFRGFTVTTPSQAFGGRANAQSTTSATSEGSSYVPFAGKGHKLGS